MARRHAIPVNLLEEQHEKLLILSRGSLLSCSAWFGIKLDEAWRECFGNSRPDQVRGLIPDPVPDTRLRLKTASGRSYRTH